MEAKRVPSNNDKGVFDVSKPGKSQPDETSRPLITGRKPIMPDPMMSQQPESTEGATEAITKEPENLTPSHTAKIIQPLEATPAETPAEATDEPSSSTEAEASKPEDKPPETADTDSSDEATSDDAAVVGAIADQAGAKKKDVLTDEEKKKQEEIQLLIVDKKYFVPTSTPHHKRNRWIFVVLIGLALLVGAVLAADAGAFGSSVKLPFDFIKNTAPATTTEPTPTSDSQKQASETVGTVYRNMNGKFEIDNKYGWKVTEEYGEQGTDGPVIGEIKFDLPTGTKLVVKFDYGGRGGDCQPAATDKPHSLNNKCPTFELLTAEKIGTDAKTKELLMDGPGEIWLEHLYYTNTEGKPTYWTGLATNALYDAQTGKTTHTAPVTKTPQMGMFLPFDFITAKKLYYYTLVEGVDTTQVSFFDNSDVKQIEEILKSFKLFE